MSSKKALDILNENIPKRPEQTRSEHRHQQRRVYVRALFMKHHYGVPITEYLIHFFRPFKKNQPSAETPTPTKQHAQPPRTSP